MRTKRINTGTPIALHCVALRHSQHHHDFHCLLQHTVSLRTAKDSHRTTLSHRHQQNVLMFTPFNIPENICTITTSQHFHRTTVLQFHCTYITSHHHDDLHAIQTNLCIPHPS